MERVTLTAGQRVGLVVQHRAALAGKMKFSEIIMPNGKRLANCPGDYVWLVGIAVSECGDFDPALVQLPAIAENETTREVDEMLFGSN